MGFVADSEWDMRLRRSPIVAVSAPVFKALGRQAAPLPKAAPQWQLTVSDFKLPEPPRQVTCVVPEAGFSRIDRRIGGPPCARRWCTTEARKTTTVSSGRRAQKDKKVTRSATQLQWKAIRAPIQAR
jgi:hypothetical protein